MLRATGPSGPQALSLVNCSAYTSPELDENSAPSMCYTSGTTGNPKAALYSHRSTLLHAFGAALPYSLNLSSRVSVVPVVPMFHVNAWGVPYSAAATGCKLVLPGPALDGKSIYELLEAQKVTMAAGVPTVWQLLLGHMLANGLKEWDERLIVVVMKNPGATPTREELLACYEGKIANWQVPDDAVFVDAIPLGNRIFKRHRTPHEWA